MDEMIIEKDDGSEIRLCAQYENASINFWYQKYLCGCCDNTTATKRITLNELFLLLKNEINNEYISKKKILKTIEDKLSECKQNTSAVIFAALLKEILEEVG